MAQTVDDQSGTMSEESRRAQSAHRMLYTWSTRAAVVAVVLVTSLLIWGPEMGFPTTYSHEISSDGSVTLERTLRDVTAGAIDDTVD